MAFRDISRSTIIATALGMVGAVAAGVFIASRKLPAPAQRVAPLAFEVWREGRWQAGVPGQVVASGERLRLRVQAESARPYLTVLALDEAGRAEVVYPASERPARLPVGETRVPVSGLAAEPGTVRVWALLCAKAYRVAFFRRTLQSSVQGFLPPSHCQQLRAYWTRAPSSPEVRAARAPGRAGEAEE